MAAVFSGELTRAAQLLEDAVRRHRAVDDLAGAAECGFKLAVVVGLLGDTDRALELCRESQDVTAAHGESWIRADALFAESLIRWQRGERARADAPAREALRLLRPLTDRWGIALCVEVVAWNAAADGAMERAARLLGILRRLWEAIGGTLFAAPFMTESHRRCETDVRRALPERVYERAVRRGAGLTLDEALAYVLEESPADEEPYERAGLTRREREVAGLVAAGLSNKEIAARLLITRRTVESHVGRTLAKLGLTSRSQLTAWAHRRRSAD